MDVQALNKELGNIDLYLLDQILKGSYSPSMKILDAGCGEGRNLTYFLRNGYEVYGIDKNPGAIRMLQFVAASLNPKVDKTNFIVGELDQLPYAAQSFDLVICSAVLHFARNHQHFEKMMKEVCRVLKSNGQLFIRTASSIGIEDKIADTGNGCFDLPDGSNRYLIHRQGSKDLPELYGLKYLEPFKTINVDEQRCMSNLVLRKI